MTLIRRLLAVLATAITMGAGLVATIDLTVGTGAIAAVFLRLVVVTLAIMIFTGILNLLLVHGGRLVGLQRNWPYSLLMLVSAIATVAIWLAGQQDISAFLLNAVQVSIESALAALLLFALVYGAYRLSHRKFTWAGLLFTISLLIVLLGALPLAETESIGQVRDWLLAVPTSAGARGMLLGIALGTIVTGVRVLVGQDRSYRE
jgi:hypothetical protein